jgi:hypothetical protein
MARPGGVGHQLAAWSTGPPAGGLKVARSVDRVQPNVESAARGAPDGSARRAGSILNLGLIFKKYPDTEFQFFLIFVRVGRVGRFGICDVDLQLW